MTLAESHARPGRSRMVASIIVGLLLIAAVSAYPAAEYLRGSWHWKKARAAIAARDFRAAEEHLDACRRQWPDSAEVAFVSARNARQAGDRGAASSFLADARRLNWPPEQVDLESALLAIQGGTDYSAIGRLMDSVRRDHHDSALILEVLAPAALKALDFALAADCLDRWVHIDPNNPRSHFARGDLLERLRAKNDALEEFKTAVALAPDQFDMRARLGRLLLEMKRSEEAATEYEWLAERRPSDPAIRLGLAQCRYEIGRKDEAGEMLDALLTEQPKNAAALALRGRIDFEANRPAQAERWFRLALDQAPFHIDFMFNLERALYVQEKTAEAEALKKRREAAEADQHDVGKLMLEIRNKPNDPEPRRQLAIRMMRNGLEAAAKRWLEVAIQLDPQYAPSYESMADYYEKVGNQAAAAEFRARAKALSGKRN